MANDTALGSISALSGIKGSLNRAETDLQIALNTRDKALNTKLVQLTQLPTTLVNYYKRNKQTTNRAYINDTVDATKTDRFSKIKNVVLFGRDGGDVDANSGDSNRELNINLTSKDLVMISPKEFMPVEGDHIIIISQGIMAVPYEVTDVQPLLYIYNDSYKFRIEKSNKYESVLELEQNVSPGMIFEYIYDNLGSNDSVVLSEDAVGNINELSDIFKSLNKSYCQAFYDDTYDMLALRPSWNKLTWFCYVSMVTFQKEEEILKYSDDLNTLFIESIPDISNTNANYLKSLFIRLKDRNFTRLSKDIDQEEIYDSERANTAKSFTTLYEVRDVINERHNYVYKAKYDYNHQLFFRGRKEHGMLTGMYRSRFQVNDLIDCFGYAESHNQGNFIWYRIDNPILVHMLDLWMDDEVTSIPNKLLKALKRYMIDRDNIDDYLGIPLILYIIASTVKSLSTSSKPNTSIE